MLERLENPLKFLCLALAALLFFRVVQRVVRLDPLGSASIPPLPTLTVATPATNSASTNKIDPSKAPATNTITNLPATEATNAQAKMKPLRHGRRPGMMMMMGGMGGPGGNLKLPPGIQARVDRIKESEILGPFMRPAPMALLGIADDDVFLRAPDGQTGMVKEGGELGGVKLVRIGINRVLVEENGEKKELTLFDGFGGESLMPKEETASTNAAPTNAAPALNQKEHH